jgi:serine phosphatase RsbU (regulator of sigma subunit)
VTGPDEPQIELVNGGHVSPLIVRANGQIETIAEGDLPVGVFDFATFHSIPIRLETGDRIVLLTDGITEAENVEGIQFGTSQLERYLAEPNPVETLFRALEQFCMGTRPQDDQTILTIDRIQTVA